MRGLFFVSAKLRRSVRKKRIHLAGGDTPDTARCSKMSVGYGRLDLQARKGKEMASSIVVEQNQQTAMAFVRELVGGDLRAYFQSEQTIAFVWVECERNAEIQRLTTNYVWGSFDRASHNKQALQNKLREVFGLPN